MCSHRFIIGLYGQKPMIGVSTHVSSSLWFKKTRVERMQSSCKFGADQQTSESAPFSSLGKVPLQTAVHPFRLSDPIRQSKICGSYTTPRVRKVPQYVGFSSRARGRHLLQWKRRPDICCSGNVGPAETPVRLWQSMTLKLSTRYTTYSHVGQDLECRRSARGENVGAPA